MNSYSRTGWVDHVVDSVSGQVIQEGTPQSAKNFNNMEDGIFQATELGNVLIQQVLQHKRNIADLEGEIKEVPMTNTLAYPFTNSAKTVSLSKARDTTNYRVATEIVSADGPIEDIEVYDKQLNGFKLKYMGSAKNVVIKCYIQGGMR